MYIWYLKNVSKAPCMALMKISLPMKDKRVPSGSNSAGSLSSKPGYSMTYFMRGKIEDHMIGQPGNISMNDETNVTFI